MANPAWFKFSEYMDNKLAALKAADPDHGWTSDEVAQAFSDAGFGGEEGAFNHFNQYGNSADENISPNNLFNAKQYYYFKAQQLKGYDSVSQVTEAEAAMVKAAIHDAGMSAWQHYIDYGTKEGVNPSNSFDTKKYLEAKAAALNAAAEGGKTDWDADSVADAFKAADMNALEHAILYSADNTAGEAARVFDSTGAVVDAYKVDDKADTGDDDSQTYTLTVSRDVVVGTNGDDTIIAPEDKTSGTNNGGTLTAGDNIDGGAGTDTLELYRGEFTGVTMKNVEIVNAYTGNAIDVSGYDGVQQVWQNGNNNVTAKLEAKVGFAGQQTNAVTATFVDASGTTDKGTVALNGVNGNQVTVSNTASTNYVEAQTLELTGSNYLSTGFTNKKMTSLTITGEGSLAKNVKNATTTIEGDGATGVLASVEASGATGDLSIVFADKTIKADAFSYNGSAGKDKIDFTTDTGYVLSTTKATIDLGAGDDTLTVGAGGDANDGPAAGSSIKGGDGTDTLVLVNIDSNDVANAYKDAWTAADQGKMISGFETLTLKADKVGTISYKAGVLSDVVNYNIDTSGTVPVTSQLDNLSSGTTVTVKALSTGADTVNLNLAPKQAESNTANLTIKLDNGASEASDGSQIDTALTTNAHVLNFESNGAVTSAAHNAVVLSNTAALKMAKAVDEIHIKGDQAFDFSMANLDLDSVRIVDGSEATAALVMDLSNNKAGVSGDKTHTFTYTGGSKGDDVTFGTTKDGNQCETWVLNKGASLISSHDAITNFDLTNDRIDVSAFGIASSAAKTVTTTAAKLGAVAANPADTEISVTTAADFFKDSAVKTQSDGTNTAVFIDGDGSGSWNADADQVILLVGVNAATQATIDSGVLTLTA